MTVVPAPERGNREHPVLTPSISLLERLRERSPGKSDRELLEDLATITLGFETIARVQQRNADTDEDEVLAEAVKAVHEVRRELAERQRG